MAEVPRALVRQIEDMDAVSARVDAAITRRAQSDTADGIEQLATLPLIEYDRRRAAEAKRLGMRVSTLDSEVSKLRPKGEPETGQKLFEDVEPWHDPVDGAALLDDVAATFTRYVALPEHAAEALALWVMHAHQYESFEHSPRLDVSSPEKRCGKTLTLDVMQTLCTRALRTENVSTAALFRIIEAHAPTLLVDECDSFLRDNDELRGALNAGHKRGGCVLRVEGDAHEVRAFNTFGPVALAGIGELPGTLADRSIRITMKRARPGEVRERFDSRRTHREKQLQRKLARWAEDNRVALADADPVMPDGFFNRVADNWRPLLAIADAAGAEWPARARAAAIGLTGDRADVDSVRTELLADIRDLFAKRETDRLLSADIVEALSEMEERRWPEWHAGKPITVRQLAALLRPFGISPGTIRLSDSKTAKGYYLTAFSESFARYLPETSVTPSQPSETSHYCENPSVTPEKHVTDKKSKKPLDLGQCDVVTDENSPDGEESF